MKELNEKLKKLKNKENVELENEEILFILNNSENAVHEGETEYYYDEDDGDYSFGKSLYDEYRITRVNGKQNYRLARISEDEYIIDADFITNIEYRSDDDAVKNVNIVKQLHREELRGYAGCSPDYVDVEDIDFNESFLSEMPIVDYNKLLEKINYKDEKNKVTLFDIINLPKEDLEQLVEENKQIIDENERYINEEKLNLIKHIKEQQAVIREQEKDKELLKNGEVYEQE